jgi:thiol-disulfide isomerase/thioredoxin
MVNGDYYVGQLQDCDQPGVLCWQSDAAVSPYRFDLSTVSAVHFQRDGELWRPKGEFCLELVGGDAFFGSLVGLSADVLEFETAAFGRLRIERRHVQRLQAWGDSSGIEYLGPDGLRGWTTNVDGAWREEAGHPLTEKPSWVKLSAVAIPQQASIEVELSWQKKADFSLQIGDAGEGGDRANAIRRRGAIVVSQALEKAPTAFELAIWGESVVLVREQDKEADLASLKKLEPGAGRLSLRLQFDQAAGVVSAYSLEGKFLGSVKAEGPAEAAISGVRLVNKQGDVRLERLMVRRWGGAPPPEVAANGEYLQLRDDSIVAAEGTMFDGNSSEFVVAAAAGERRIPAGQVVCLMMPSAEAPGFGLRASLQDSVRINGELQKVEGGRLFVIRPGITKPIQIPVDQLQSLIAIRRVAAPQATEGRVGRLETAGILSHGMLVDAEISSEASCLSWQPQGSSVGSPLRLGVEGRIVYRAARPVARRPVARRPPAERNRGVWGALLESFENPIPEPVGALGDFDQLLWLRAGDRIPCRVESIDERGITFETPILQATFVPHVSVKAWDRRAGTQPRPLEEDKLKRLLTLVRMQRENPPTHLIESNGGDFVRGRLKSLDDKFLHLEVRLETKRIPRDQVARIIWLNDEPNEGAKGAEPPMSEDDPDAASAPAAAMLQVQAVCSNGVRLTFEPETFAAGVLSGASTLLGPCAVPVADVDQLYLGKAIASAAREINYSMWRLQNAPDPRFVSEEGAPAAGDIAGLESALVGQPAPDFNLELAEGGKFRLSEQKGRVVVLDFWATWCGWCMQSMPELDVMADEFGDRISWVAVNLQEDRKTIAASLERLGIAPRVALDIDGATAEKFGVTAIPQTVVVDAEGKVVRVFVGGGPNAVDQIRAAIRETLGGNAGAADEPPADRPR